MVIEEKLEEARQRSSKRRMQIAIALFATICLCGLMVIGLSTFDLSARKDVPVVASKKEPLSIIDREKIRGDFKEILQQYENELEPRLQVANVELWDQDGLFEINELKKKALSDFSNSDYLKAQDNIQLLKNKTIKIIEEAENIFSENLQQAASFLEEDLYDEAKVHIEKALMVASQSPEALSIQQEIEKLPHILPILNEAKISRAENDLHKEFDYLQQVLQVAPEREEVTSRLKELAELIKNKEFAEHISLGLAGIENRQAKEARYHYLEAKKIDSERSELSLLLAQLLILEKSIRFKQTVKQAEQAVGRDDWQQAKNYFTRAAKDAPENQTVLEGLKRSGQVLELLTRLGQYFRNPYRLANKDVRSEAEKILVQADTVSSYSFSVKKQAEQLRELIIKLNRFIPVTIISDNKTNVLVRSVGKVGAVSEKIIQLKPGNYTFEGARDGFKSKLVQTFIPYDQHNFSVRVICDEPI